MVDLHQLLDSTTPDVGTIPAADIDDAVTRGTRRRVAKRAGAVVLGLTLLGGAAAVVADLGTRVDPPFTVEDAQTAGWTRLPVAPIAPREVPYVGELTDGRLVVAGGYDDLSGEADPVAYRDGAVLDETGRAWDRLPRLPFGEPVDLEVVDFTLRGEVLWASRSSGFHEAPASTYDDGSIARLDLAGDPREWSWELLPPTPIPGLSHATVTVIDGAVVVTGASRTRDPLRVAVWREGRWLDGGATPTGATTDAFLAIDREVLVVAGGVARDGTVLDAAAVLDLTSLAWRPVKPMPIARHAGAGAGTGLVVDRRAWIGGGYATVESGGQPSVLLDDGSVVDDAEGGAPLQPATPVNGASWLDLATGTWAGTELRTPVDAEAVRDSALDVPSALTLWSLEASSGPIRTAMVTPGGTVLALPSLPLPDGEWYSASFEGTIPALVHGSDRDRRGDRVATRTTDGRYEDVTFPGTRSGTTYLSTTAGLLAVGGRATDGSDDSRAVTVWRRAD